MMNIPNVYADDVHTSTTGTKQQNSIIKLALGQNRPGAFLYGQMIRP